ncbi:MAG: hypothetical protein QXD37_01965 [Zestosphaera sp.]
MSARLKVSVFLSLFLLANLLSANTYYAATQPSMTNYYLSTDGSVLVELIFSNVSQQVLEVSLEQGFDASTLQAVDSDGAFLPVDLVGDKAVVNVVSSVEWVKLLYVIVNNAEITDDVVFKFRLRPQGDCTVYVPGEFLLLTYSGNPVIDLVGETLLLEYKGSEVVEITVVMLQPATHATTSLPPSQPGAEGNLTTVIAVSVAIISVLVFVFLYLKSRKHK